MGASNVFRAISRDEVHLADRIGPTNLSEQESMRLFTRAVALFILLQLTEAVPQEQAKKATIEGTVTRADNGQPIAGTQLTISSFNALLCEKFSAGR